MSSYVDAQAIRRQTLGILALLVEYYPNLPVGRIVGEACQNFDPYVTTDEDLVRGLNQLLVTYTQLGAAGIRL